MVNWPAPFGAVARTATNMPPEYQTMFARDGSVLFRNEMKLFYRLKMTLVGKLTNRMASFHFGTIRNSHVRT